MKYFFIAIIIFINSICFADTFYVDGSASDDTGDGSIGSPKKYIESGILLMSAGDTLIIVSGTYTGTNNMIGEDSTCSTYPPSGNYGVDTTPMTTDDVYTTIQSDIPGGVVIDGEYNHRPFYNNNAFRNYLKIDGIHFRRGSVGVFSIYGSYNKVTRCGFEDGISPATQTETPIAMLGGGSSYSLFEDCYAWGKGRYGIYASSTDGGTNHCIFRRCVVRTDDTPTNGFVSSGIRFYNGQNDIAQNCIVIDSTPNSASTNQGAFATGGSSSDGDLSHQFLGCIALNNQYWAGLFPERLDETLTVTNCVFWGNGTWGGAAVSSTGEIGSNIIINWHHITAGYNGYSNFRSNPGYPVTENLLDSISVFSSDWGAEDIDTANYVNTYGNSSGAATGVSITNGVTSNPIGASLKYLPRIEGGSTLSGAASDSGDIGATVIYKIGTDGTLYGQSGYNTVTSNPLWPFPNEDLIRTKMAAYSGGDRGFCASGKTLTKYIWEYLGNEIPAEIYGTTPTISGIVGRPGVTLK